MTILLRRLTLKSKIGFGFHSDKTVAELFLLYKELELLRMYYLYEGIDFDQEIKDKLFITKERQIVKPGHLKQPSLHPVLQLNSYDIIALCLFDFNEHNNTEAYKIMRGSYIRSEKKQRKHYVNRQWGNKKEYYKGCMAWINRHYGINR